ncbi:MAG: hypothetical protein EAX86_13535 [Candidatus Heimdallarchaeota archaeon]|nr:hypothetical protein [Candidatus Heimdallarchaeota archaeon]
MGYFQKYSKYIPLQAIIIAIFLIYIAGLSFSFIFFAETFFPPPDENHEKTYVTINLIIESTHPDYLFNHSYLTNVTINITLIEHLNNTIGIDNWEGRYYTPGGWFVTRIFNASENSNWSWRIYFHLPGTQTWTYAPVGASSIRLDNEYFIKFSFEEG